MSGVGVHPWFAHHGAKQNQFEGTSPEGAVEYHKGQGVMHRTKTPVSPRQVVPYKKAVSVPGTGQDEGHGCFAHLASANPIK